MAAALSVPESLSPLGVKITLAATASFFSIGLSTPSTLSWLSNTLSSTGPRGSSIRGPDGGVVWERVFYVGARNVAQWQLRQHVRQLVVCPDRHWRSMSYSINLSAHRWSFEERACFLNRHVIAEQSVIKMNSPPDKYGL